MAGTNLTQAPQDASLVRKWAGRRRAVGIMAVIGISFFAVIASELDHPIFAIDDITAVFLGVLVLVLYMTWRKHDGLSNLKRDTNVFTAMLAVAFLVKFIWLFVELGDPDAFGDDATSIFFLGAVLLNRFM